jgi:hypothetical protein
MSSQAKGESEEPTTPPNASFLTHLARFKHSPTPPPSTLAKLPSAPVSPTPIALNKRSPSKRKQKDISTTSRHFKRDTSELDAAEEERDSEVRSAACKEARERSRALGERAR